MRFERENAKPIDPVSEKQLLRGLGYMMRPSDSRFAILTAADGGYVQVGGSGLCCTLEWRDAGGRHFRASQQPPVVPWPGETELFISSGVVRLRQEEFFRMAQAQEAFLAFFRGEPFPDCIQWRDVSREVPAISSNNATPAQDLRATRCFVHGPWLSAGADKMKALCEEILECVKKTGFSGVVSIQSGGSSYAQAFGCRDRANQIENQLSTRFGIASGTKGFTAVGIAMLIEKRQLHFTTRARDLLGEHLKNLHPDITVAHLLEHTSGAGDYLDEEKIQDFDNFVLSVPVQHLLSPLDYAPLIEKEAQKFPPGERFSYSNSGYVILAMILELVSRQPFHEFIETQVFKRAGMTRSGFFRSDQLPSDTATGYIQDGDSWRSNVFQLPVRGSGDGGAYSNMEDMQKFWRSLKSFHLVNGKLVSKLLQPRQRSEKNGNLKYGYGFWLDDPANQMILEGCDAGVSFRSATGLNDDDGYTVISNTSSGAWPLVRLLTPYFQMPAPEWR